MWDLWWTKWRWARFSPRTLVSPANIHSICFSTIFFTITRGWHNRPGVAAVPIASQTRIKKKFRQIDINIFYFLSINIYQDFKKVILRELLSLEFYIGLEVLVALVVKEFYLL
jgi:hypothetical protein